MYCIIYIYIQLLCKCIYIYIYQLQLEYSYDLVVLQDRSGQSLENSPIKFYI